ncbi:MAG: hypothetical protein QXD70_02300 [Candidatus Bathyarchaeia archaeon]
MKFAIRTGQPIICTSGIFKINAELGKKTFKAAQKFSLIFLNRLFGAEAELIKNAIVKSFCLKFEMKYEKAKNAELADFLKKINHK